LSPLFFITYISTTRLYAIRCKPLRRLQLLFSTRARMKVNFLNFIRCINCSVQFVTGKPITQQKFLQKHEQVNSQLGDISGRTRKGQWDHGVDDRGFGFRQGLEIFLFTTVSRPALGPTQLCI